MLTLTTLLFACSGGSDVAVVTRDLAGDPVAFARIAEQAVTLDIPDTARAAPVSMDRRLPVDGPFHLIRTIEGVQVWETAIPVRPRNLFFSKAPSGMAMFRGGERISFRDGRNGDAIGNTWDFTAHTLQIRTDDGEPQPGELELIYPRANERDSALNLGESGLAPTDFVTQSVQLGEDTRTGLLLPAPARATWVVDIPTNGVIDFDGVVLPPEANDGSQSTGATIAIEVELDGTTTTLETTELELGEWESVRVDVSQWAGQRVSVSFVTGCGDDPYLDYVFLSEPTLYTPVSDPKRVLMVFIDTLRPDHMGIYGYERDTTPRLNEWAEGAAVFTNGRSVAPWTLPSSRSAFSGNQPEAWDRSENVAEQFAAEGWATGGFVGNIYLSANFDMSAGWDTYNVVNWPEGGVQVDKVEEFLERHEDRDSLVLLHLMDMHLPYTEPRAYRNLWAGDTPDGLQSSSTRNPILRAANNNLDEVREWLIARYDQNMRYLDDTLADLFEGLGDDTSVMLFADHGEEFWDHDEFEHGHSLYDELLRVPFIVKGAGVEAGVFDWPVSLLDVTPTTLELGGVESNVEMTGRSVIESTGGDTDSIEWFRGRDQAFGRPLYGTERWGVLTGDMKWTSHAGVEEVYNLGEDLGEQSNLRESADLAELRESFGEALGRRSEVVWRLNSGSARRTPNQDLVVEFNHPAGFRSAWLGGDPLGRGNMTVEVVEGIVANDTDAAEALDTEQAPPIAPPNRVVVTYKAGTKGARELFLEPAGDAAEFGGLTMRVVSGAEGQELTARDGLEGSVTPDGESHIILRGRIGGRAMTVNFASSPAPAGGELEIDAVDAEVSEALRALGYLD
jgi:arylsulfatase A-like enzyme